MPIYAFYSSSFGGGTPLNLVSLGLNPRHLVMFTSTPSVHDSRRAPSFHGARRATVPSLSMRYVLPFAVSPTRSSLRPVVGAPCCTHPGARRGCASALRFGAMSRRCVALPVAREQGGCVRLHPAARGAGEVVRTSRFAGGLGPNLPVNADALRRGFARAAVAGYLTR